MKRFWLLVCACLVTGKAFAQTPVSPPATVPHARVTFDTPYDPGNPLARQARGEAAGVKLFEDPHVVAFLLDAQGHFIVTSKGSHARNIPEIDPAENQRLFTVAQKVMAAEIVALGADGFMIRTTGGSQSGIAQYHVHGFPSFAGLPAATTTGPVPAAEILEPVAMRVRAAMR